MKGGCRFTPAWGILAILTISYGVDATVRIRCPGNGSNSVTLEFDCDTNEYYRLMVANSLLRGEWAITNMGLGSPASLSWSDHVPQVSRFFCVLRIPLADALDADSDGLNDVFELNQPGFNPLDSSDAWRDTDGDGMPDGWEILYGFSPENLSDAVVDMDHDGLSNLQEFVFRTNPLARDTDQDGLSDEEEVTAGLDPLSNPLQHRLTSLVFTYDDQDRLEHVESPPTSIQMGYDAAANLTDCVCSKGE